MGFWPHPIFFFFIWKLGYNLHIIHKKGGDHIYASELCKWENRI